MREPENFVELEYVTNYETKSIISIGVEEETSTMAQGEVGNIYGTRDDIPNPNPETSDKSDEMTG
jgi:hypothetical protein